MAFAHSPKIVTDGMVFYYDTGNSKSYAGEPTTNLVAGVNGVTVQSGTFTTNTTVDGVRVLENNQVNNSHVMWNGANGIIVNCSAGAFITVSAEYRTTCTIRMRFRDNPYDTQYDLDGGNIPTINETSVDIPATNGEWVRYSLTAQTSTANPDLWWYLADYRPNNEFGKVEIRNWQIEVKSHATPYVNGTRSATEALKDFTKNATLDLSNVSFDSNAQMEFDGTDDWLNIPITLNAGNFTYETVMKQFGSTSYQIFSAGTGDPSNGGTNIQAVVNSSGGLVNLYAPVGGSGWEYGTYNNTGNFTATSNVNYHIVVVNSNTTWKIYVNGELVGDIDSFVPTVGNRVGVARSAMQAANDKSSQVSLTKIYNRALSAAEVQQNFNTIKGRFGL